VLVKSDRKKTHKASFTVQASVSLLRESLLRVSKFYGQATKGTRWMPRRVKAMKDVVSCDKPGRGANNP
jgi:hypothetical protein